MRRWGRCRRHGRDIPESLGVIVGDGRRPGRMTCRYRLREIHVLAPLLVPAGRCGAKGPGVRVRVGTTRMRVDVSAGRR